MKSIKELGNKFINLYGNLTNDDSSWENRQYDFYLIFGQTEENKSPWITTNWKSDFEPYFDMLINQNVILKETGIRATKYKPEKRISKKENEEFVYHSDIKLGRLKWDEKSHEKWTMPNNTENYFLNFELWSPIWTICEKRQSPPEIYISISNERDFEKKRDIKFGYFIVVAIAKSLKFDSKPIMKELSERINSKATILKTRRWGKPEKAGNWTFVNWIQDTFSKGIYKEKNLHSLEFDKLEFEPIWEVIYRNK
ncbi:hypothetical protein [Flavobacterium seoulense]|uniref:Uncharacterized protein n=1 Tax=Flavobacterium seoulense TaxID=1492738 RepID=A0A066WYM7_9FLAO|nr:hypothetical protein [Flavobacterium seoulense]KDN55770.1 hypothetical protein FEM21_11610 [Flavobacterium seoulense]